MTLTKNKKRKSISTWMQANLIHPFFRLPALIVEHQDKEVIRVDMGHILFVFLKKWGEEAAAKTHRYSWKRHFDPSVSSMSPAALSLCFDSLHQGNTLLTAPVPTYQSSSDPKLPFSPTSPTRGFPLINCGAMTAKCLNQ